MEPGPAKGGKCRLSRRQSENQSENVAQKSVGPQHVSGVHAHPGNSLGAGTRKEEGTVQPNRLASYEALLRARLFFLQQQHLCSSQVTNKSIGRLSGRGSDHKKRRTDPHSFPQDSENLVHFSDHKAGN